MPKTRAVVPPSLMPDDCVPAKPFSSSSIQTTFGAVLSATRMALRMFSSLCPTMPPKIFPTSMRSSGRRHSEAMALLERDLPHPCTPNIECLWARQAELAGFFGEGDGALVHPVFEQIQAADIREGFRGGVVFQEAGLADDLLFFRKNDVHIKRVLLDQGLGEDVFRLGGGQAQGGLQDALALLAWSSASGCGGYS